MSVEIPKDVSGLPTSKPRFIGQKVQRIEDPAAPHGPGTEFIDNLTLPRHAALRHPAQPRRPRAHHAPSTRARRRSMPGVFAVVTGEDALRWTQPGPTLPEGWGTRCLATDKVRFVGEPVAAVAAVSRYVAEDALEQIEVDYEPLEVGRRRRARGGVEGVARLRGAGHERDAPACLRVGRGGSAPSSGADHVFTEKFRWNRLGANPMETFGVISQWDPGWKRASPATAASSRHRTWRWGAPSPWGFPPTRCASSAIPTAGASAARAVLPRHGHHRAALTQSRRAPGQVDRRSHGVSCPAAAARPGIASTRPPSRSKAGRQASPASR